jgi:hypothetical protein
MATSYNPNIVKDGLIAYFDAENRKSYPGSGSTWFDLTNSGKDFSLQGTDFAESPSRFEMIDNQGDHIISSSTDIMAGLGAFSIDIWMKIDILPSTSGIFSYADDVAPGGNAVLIFKNTSSIQLTINNDLGTLIYASTNDNYHVGEYMNLAVTRSGASFEFYINGASIGSSSCYGSNVPSGGNGTLVLGQEQDTVGGGFQTTQDLDGSFSSLKIYNKELTDEEILQNYNVMKGRFQ